MKKGDLISLGYSEKEMEKMYKRFPSLLTYSINKIEEKQKFFIFLGYTKKQIHKMSVILPALYSLSNENITKKINDLMSLGYTKEELITITVLLPMIFNYSIENIKEKIECLQQFGYTKEEVIKMTIKLPSLLGYSLTKTKQKMDFLKSIGIIMINPEDAQELIICVELLYARYMFYKECGMQINKDNYQLLFLNSKNFNELFHIKKQELLEKYNYEEYLKEHNINLTSDNKQTNHDKDDKFIYLESLGYTDIELEKMYEKQSNLFSYHLKNIQEKVAFFENFGYTKEQIKKMTIMLPAIFGYSLNNIKQKLQDLMDLGYTKEQVIIMTIELPALFSYSMDNIKEKIDFLKSVQLDFIVTKNTKQLIKSVELVFARYMFFNEKNIEINDKTCYKLFYKNKEFEKYYGITKEDLLKKYDYESYVKEQNDILNGKIVI